MPIDDFFPPRPAAAPTIYAFASPHPDYMGLLMVGYTERSAAERAGRGLDRAGRLRVS